jgi:hypothetical protein
MSDLALKNKLYTELEKASPAVLRQLFEFLLFLKRAEKNIAKNGTTENPIKKYIGCMAGVDGDAFAAAIENEFKQIEGER